MRLIVLLVFNAVVWSFYACHDSALEEAGSAEAADSSFDASIPLPSEIEQGEALADSLGCSNCHQSADPSSVLAGADAPVADSESFGGNLTPDPLTGLGKWTNTQIANAIRLGVGPNGAPLCPTMPRYSELSAGDLAALVNFLQNLAPVIHTVAASVCADAATSNAESAQTLEDGGGAAAIDPTMRGTRFPAPGELVISEVMDDPSGPEPNDEWFELHNVTDVPLALRGLTVVDADSRFFQVASAADLGPGGFAIFARTLEGAQMTLVPTPAYVYGEALGATQGVVLLNDDRGALAVLVGTVLIDRFDYGGVAHRTSGATVERIEPNDTGILGCVATNPWAMDAGRGTPLAPTDCADARADALSSASNADANVDR